MAEKTGCSDTVESQNATMSVKTVDQFLQSSKEYKEPGYAILDSCKLISPSNEWSCDRRFVSLRDQYKLADEETIKDSFSWILGVDDNGNQVCASIVKNYSLLIAGEDNAGKSVSLDNLLINILVKASPYKVNLLMMDFSPSKIGLGRYTRMPHLKIPVTGESFIEEACDGLMREINRRYDLIQRAHTKSFEAYNSSIDSAEEQLLPLLLIIYDLEDFQTIPLEFLQRISIHGRKTGIYTIVSISGTARTLVYKKLSGLFDAKLVGKLSEEKTKSLDIPEKCKRLGEGDFLFKPYLNPTLIHLQGCFVSDEEVVNVVNFWERQNIVSDKDLKNQVYRWMNDSAKCEKPIEDERDEMFLKAAEYIIDSEKASIGNLQRVFRIGFNRAARIMDQLADAGIVGKDEGTKARQILLDRGQFEDWKRDNGY